jgi:hypothetical protein
MERALEEIKGPSGLLQFQVVVALLLALNSGYFLVASLVPFGSFSIGTANFQLALLYGAFAVIIGLAMLYVRRKVPSHTVRFIAICLVVCALWSSALLVNAYYWAVGVLLNVLAVLVSLYAIGQNWSARSERA